MFAAEIAIREGRPQQHGIFQIRGCSDCSRNVTMRLEGENTPHQRCIAGAQRLWKRDPWRPPMGNAWNRPRSLIGTCAIRSERPIAIPGSRRLPVRGGRERPRKDRSPGEKRPSGRKAGERMTDPSHTVWLAAPAVRRNPALWNYLQYLRQDQEYRDLPGSNPVSHLRLCLIHCAS